MITHGKVSLKHFVSDERGYGYFINFENSNTAPPHFDLLPFLIKSARTYPVQCDDCVDWLYNYFRYFPLKEEELLLMQSYMAFPGSALELVKGYSDGKSHLSSELDNVTQLQTAILAPEECRIYGDENRRNRTDRKRRLPRLPKKSNHPQAKYTLIGSSPVMYIFLL